MTAKSKKQIGSIFNTLSAFYGDSILRQGWRETASWWEANSAVELMVGAILVQNTNWRNVDKALNNFQGKLAAKFIIDTTNDELATIIRPAGFQNQKAKKLKALFVWFETFNFDVQYVSKLSKSTLRKQLLKIN